jgi:hypothetical protein
MMGSNYDNPALMNPSMCGLAPVYESRQNSLPATDDVEMIFEGEPA